MIMEGLKQVVTRNASRSLLLGKKFSPEILTVAGIAGVVAAGVMAARATLKLEAVITEHKHQVEDVKEITFGTDSTGRELTKVYVRTTGHIVKLYGPSVTLGAAGIFSILSGHNIMRKRNAALVVAYKGLESAFNRYRQTIVDEYGEDRERELFYRGAVKEIDVIHEDGRIEKSVSVDASGISPYARIYDESTSKEWQRETDYNLAKIRAEQNYLNDRLMARGYVFLNEAYRRLGLEESEAGQIVGWKWDSDGDNHIDFGLFKGTDVNEVYDVVALSNAHNAYLLDFNVDGPILSALKK